MVTLKSIKRAAANFANSMGAMFAEPTVDAWVRANIRTSELARSRFAPKDGAAYIPHLRGWVDMCAKKNASTCSEAELCHYRKGGNGTKIGKQRRKKLRGVKGMADGAREVVEVENSTALDLLNYPSELESGAELKFMRFYSKEACGNAFIYIADNGEMMTLRPQFIAPILADGIPMVTGWVYGRGREREIAIPIEAVDQYKHLPSIDSPWLGDGPLKVCNEYADLLIFGTTAEAARWRNGNPPPYAVMLPPTITNPTQRDQAVKEIERQMNGPENAGNRLILSAAEIKPLGFPPKDMEYVEGSKVSAHMVCAAYDIPENLIWPNDSSLATASVAQQVYYVNGIWPRLKRDAQQLTEHFQRRGLLGLNEFLAYENPCDEDNQAEATYWQGLTSAGIATLDEAREDIGLPPLPDGLGEKPRFSGSVLVADAPEPATSTPQDPNAPPDSATSEKKTLQLGIKDRASDAAARKKRDKIEEEMRLALIAWFLSLYDTITTTTVTIIPGVSPAQPVGTITVPNLPTHPATPIGSAPVVSMPAPVAPTAVNWSVPPAKVQELDKIIEKGQHEAVREQIAVEAERTGLPKVSPQKPIQIVDARRRTVLESVTNTTNNDVRQVISNGIEQGQTVEQIAEELRASGYSVQRANVIAQTEVAHAGEVAAREFATDKGFDWKTWYLGPKPCTVCTSIHRKVKAAGGSIPIGQPFAMPMEFGQSEQVDIPPVHPNCMCHVVYHNKPPESPAGGA